MGFRPEPVLDIARGLSAFTSCYMVGAQILHIWKELFIDRCPHCKGAGRVICKHCGGTKTLRRRPGEYHDVHGEMVNRQVTDQYQCMHCGPMVVYDLVKEAADNEAEAFQIMDNMKDAYAGKLRRHRMPILAGTVPCPMCANNPRVIRHTPNYARIFNLEEPWWLKINQRVGAYRGDSSVRPQMLLEYPSRKPHMEDLDPEHITDTWKAEYEMAGEDWLDEILPEPQWKKDEAKEERSPTDKPPWERDEAPERPQPPSELPEDHEMKYVDDSDSEVSDSDSSENELEPLNPYPYDNQEVVL